MFQAASSMRDKRLLKLSKVASKLQLSQRDNDLADLIALLNGRLVVGLESKVDERKLRGHRCREIDGRDMARPATGRSTRVVSVGEIIIWPVDWMGSRGWRLRLGAKGQVGGASRGRRGRLAGPRRAVQTAGPDTWPRTTSGGPSAVSKVIDINWALASRARACLRSLGD